MHYWLHRITGGENASEFANKLLFEKNILSIGWSVFSNIAFLNDVSKNGIKAIEEHMENKWNEKPQNRFNLERFLCKMKKGDWVVVPTWKAFSIFEIVSDKVLCNETIDKNIFVDSDNKQATYKNGCFHKNNNCIDLGFYREVKLISKPKISREEYADQALYSRMKARQTNVNIDDICSSVKEALERSNMKKPISIKEEMIKEISPNLLNKIKKYTNDSSFESLVEWYFKSIGCEIINTPSKNESPTESGDADKVAIFERIKTIIMVQIKKHENITDEWAIKQITAFRENHDYGDDYQNQMWVISTCGDFSEKAKKIANENYVRLISGPEFCEMVLDSILDGIKNIK